MNLLYKDAPSDNPDELAKQLRTAMTASVIVVGQILMRAKRMIPHGEFKEWVVENTGQSYTTCWRMMKAAQRFLDQEGNITISMFAQQYLQAGAIYELASDSCPEEVRCEALQIAGTGLIVSYETVQELKQKFHGETFEEVDEGDGSATDVVEEPSTEGDADEAGAVALFHHLRQFFAEGDDADREAIIQVLLNVGGEAYFLRAISGRSECPICGSCEQKTSQIEQWFADFWAVVHRRVGKQTSFAKFKLAVDRVRKEQGCSKQAAARYITDRMQAFRDSPQAQDEVKGQLHPKTWLNEGRYDDDPEEWSQGTVGGEVITAEKQAAAKAREQRIAQVRARRK